MSYHYTEKNCWNSEDQLHKVSGRTLYGYSHFGRKFDITYSCICYDLAIYPPGIEKKKKGMYVWWCRKMCRFSVDICSSILFNSHILEIAQKFLSRMKKESIVSLYNRILSNSENKLLLDNRLLSKNGMARWTLSIHLYSTGDNEKLKQHAQSGDRDSRKETRDWEGAQRLGRLLPNKHHPIYWFGSWLIGCNH